MSDQVDWEQIRKEYRVTEQGAYLMNAAIGGLHSKVRRTYAYWNDILEQFAAIGDERFFDLVTEARRCCSDFLGVEPEDLAFSPNTSFNMNLLAMMLKQKSSKRQVILPEDEFPSSVLPWHHHGFEVLAVPSRKGRIELSDLLEKIHAETAAVVVSAVQFLTGYRLNLLDLGYELKKRQIPLIVNGTQQIGTFDLPLRQAHVSAFSASCHKWLGAGAGQSIFVTHPEFRRQIKWPWVGWLSVEEAWALKITKPQLKKETSAIELGIVPFANIAGIQSAIEVVQSIGLENISRRILSLSDELVEHLNLIKADILSYRGQDENKSGIVTFRLGSSVDSESLVETLKDKKIFVNTRRGYLRASIHHYNNRHDIECLMNVLRSL